VRNFSVEALRELDYTVLPAERGDEALKIVGGYPGDDYKGGQLFTKIDFIAAARWLKSRPDCTGQIGATV
jgi:hypothetical protein